MNPSLVVNLFEQLDEKIEFNTPDKVFGHVNDISHNHISSYGVYLLKQLLEMGNDDLIKTVCTDDMTKNQLYKSFDGNSILSTGAYQYTGGALYVGNGPFERAKECAKEYLDTMPDIYKSIQKYDKDIEEYEQKMKKIEERHLSDQQKVILQSDIEPPRIDIEDKFRVNSLDHLKAYGKNTDRFPILIQKLPSLETIPYNIPGPEVLVYLLYMGVGIYDPMNESLNPKGKKDYTQKVLEMSSEGYLSFLFSNDTICYGTNYPFNQVIIDDDFGNNHSINTTYQLMGRAGRVGKSYIANVHLSGSKTIQRILDYCRNKIADVSMFDEAVHIEEIAKEFI
jgi:hypothetical protein